MPRNLSYWRGRADDAELEAFNALRGFVQEGYPTEEMLLSYARDARRGHVILFRVEQAAACALDPDLVASLARSCNVSDCSRIDPLYQ